MRPSKLKNLLVHAYRHNHRILIKGKPGIGKSDLVAAATKEAGCELKIFHPAISEPTDFCGLPAVVNGGAEFLPFGKLRELCETTTPTVAFLDDIGQASVSVQAALMQLILARRVNGHTVSPTVVFCGATNDTRDMSGVVGMIEPVKSRWETILELEISLDDWVLWALDNNMPAELVAFIRTRPELLSDFKPTRELTNSPCPRSWAAVGRWQNSGQTDHEIFTGAVGAGAAAEYIRFLEEWQTLPDIDQILLNPDAAPLVDKPSLKYAVVTALAFRASKGNFEQALRYCSRLTKPFEVLYVKDATRKAREVTNTQAFTRWACVPENKEACL
jgi:hypothetical protein